MKKILLTLALLGLLIGTGIALDQAVEEKAVAIGDQAAMELVKTLKTNLSGAMKEGGPMAAVSFCSEKAQPLTSAVSDSLGKGVTVNRTSSKYRNPKNKPTPREEEALTYFEQKLADGEALPGHYLQVAESDSQTVYHYYKPMKMEAVCLTCHGAPDKMNADLLDLLQKEYPEDHAVNYEMGDFRGVLHVTIPGELLQIDH